MQTALKMAQNRPMSAITAHGPRMYVAQAMVFFLFFLLVSDCAADDAGRGSNLAKLEKWKKNSGKVSWAANDLFAGLRWICPVSILR